MLGNGKKHILWKTLFFYELLTYDCCLARQSLAEGGRVRQVEACQQVGQAGQQEPHHQHA